MGSAWSAAGPPPVTSVLRRGTWGDHRTRETEKPRTTEDCQQGQKWGEAGGTPRASTPDLGENKPLLSEDAKFMGTCEHDPQGLTRGLMATYQGSFVGGCRGIPGGWRGRRVSVPCLPAPQGHMDSAAPSLAETGTRMPDVGGLASPPQRAGRAPLCVYLRGARSSGLRPQGGLREDSPGPVAEAGAPGFPGNTGKKCMGELRG